MAGIKLIQWITRQNPSDGIHIESWHRDLVTMNLPDRISKTEPEKRLKSWLNCSLTGSIEKIS